MFAGKKSAQIREILISESAWEEMTCLFAPSLGRKIGARFIAAEPYHLVLGFKYSRRPIAYATDDKFLVDEVRSQIKAFNELYAKACN
ncbi:hypothetical protein [Enterobacter roggenkampii]|uniref:hypothetical protein n=1 Tax=Enterobacter roggenkampii TaxID=1812935 RepID=UPI00232DD919|nr:hypothetical protein [Enterobacter roggenkampii]